MKLAAGKLEAGKLAAEKLAEEGSPAPGPAQRLSGPAPQRGSPGSLEERLFAVAPASTANKALVCTGYSAATCSVAGVALLRQAGMPAWDTMWAEDGKVFYSQALYLPFARTLVTPHAGYVQVFPRLVAGIATAFAPRDASAVMAVAGALSLGALSCLVFHMARGLVPSRLLRLVLAASMVLLPVAGGELLDNAVNVPWWLFFACFWALLWRPASRAGRAASFLLCALGAASEPLTALLLPLAALRAVALRRPASRRAGARRACPSASPRSQLQANAAAGGLVVGLAYQLCTTLAGGRGGGAPVAFAPLSAGALVRAIGARVGVGLLAGVKGTDWLASRGPTLATAIGLALICAVAGAGALCPAGRARAMALVATLTAVGCFVVEAWVRGIAPVMAAGHVQSAGRYQAVPLLLLVSSLVVTASERARGGPGARRELLAGALCVVLLAPTWAVDFRDRNARSQGPSWPVGVEQAARSCAASGAASALVPIDPPGWAARAPCDVLRD